MKIDILTLQNLIVAVTLFFFIFAWRALQARPIK